MSEARSLVTDMAQGLFADLSGRAFAEGWVVAEPPRTKTGKISWLGRSEVSATSSRSAGVRRSLRGRRAITSTKPGDASRDDAPRAW